MNPTVRVVNPEKHGNPDRETPLGPSTGEGVDDRRESVEVEVFRVMDVDPGSAPVMIPPRDGLHLV